MKYQDLTFETASLHQLGRVLAVAVELTGYRYLFRTDHEGHGSYYPSWARVQGAVDGVQSREWRLDREVRRET